MLALVGVWLSACGPVPRPFQEGSRTKAENPLLAMPDRAGVTVAPPSLGPGALTGPLAERTAERLGRRARHNQRGADRRLCA